ncbi:protein FMC1 homolog [Cylas formicarius]|uniref:protein FMC1 homolog n=1 Tax=Cylas formicarius TaxID=197179 RepID=UPI002958631A|nr:protein FMC1 homolog [Cylas formicarius]
MNSKLTLLRQIISELRLALPNRKLKDDLSYQHIMGQFRKYQTTDRELCKARDEMEAVARTYLCYLRSSRITQQLKSEFHGKGERSINETARMVGFKLPHDPK